MRIDIETIWRFRKHGVPQPTSVMLGFLRDIQETGKLGEAAARNHLSYRHAWNLVNEWSVFFGTPVVERHKGKGTKLTAFGEKLVWAGQRLQARLGPQLENLSQELETELSQLLTEPPSVIRVHASHGFAVSKLREILNSTAGINVDLRYVSNQDSLVSLAHETCDLAGVHLPRGELHRRNVAGCRNWVDNRIHSVISFATREMGLMVRPDNPLRITSLKDLVNPAIRFVNRDPDSGTRLLLDQLLHQNKIDPESINGYQQVEFTHAAVAAYVASDMADVSFGVEAAARQFGLGFVRLLTEDYYFVCRKSLLELESMKHLLTIMRGAEFHAALTSLPGYAASDTGAIKTVNDVFCAEPRAAPKISIMPASLENAFEENASK